ncbi:TPA: hypothetical protein EYP38_04905, partial [Candidatus Micrarchaeota archaeon]|nr:hypothetical protein [Candidatus Micrarchaeota archaeon]
MYKGEDKVLQLIAKKKRLFVADIARISGMNVDSIRRIVESLRGNGFVRITKSESSVNSPTRELLGYAKTTFPEFSVYAKAKKGASVADLNPVEKQIGLRWAKLKGFITIEAGKILPAKEELEVADVEAKMKDVVSQLMELGKSDAPVLVDEFFQRHLVQKRVVRRIEVSYTNKPMAKLKTGFDISAKGPDAALGKKHPTSVMADRIRSIMTEMGFEEMEGGIVESSFWNFDALFQLPKAFCDWQAEHHGWRPAEDQVVHFNTVLHAIEVILWQAANRGDGVLLMTPIYPPFLAAVK